MCNEMASDFLTEHEQESYSKSDIQQLVIDENRLFYFVEHWKIRMYMYLIEQYQME